MTDYGHPITFGLSLYPSLDLVDDTRDREVVELLAAPSDLGQTPPKVLPQK